MSNLRSIILLENDWVTFYLSSGNTFAFLLTSNSQAYNLRLFLKKVLKEENGDFVSELLSVEKDRPHSTISICGPKLKAKFVLETKDLNVEFLSLKRVLKDRMMSRGVGVDFDPQYDYVKYIRSDHFS